MENKNIGYKKISNVLSVSKRFIAKIIDFNGIWNNYIEAKESLPEENRGYGFIEYDYGTICIDTLGFRTGFFYDGEVEIKNNMTKNIIDEEAVYVTCEGPFKNVFKTMRELMLYNYEHGILLEALVRVVIINENPYNEDENVYEIQAIIHNWDKLLIDNLSKYLDVKTMNEIISEHDSIHFDSPKSDKVNWMIKAVKIMDNMLDENKKSDILSGCAEIYSKERIEYMREIYLKNNKIEDVLEEMKKDKVWYGNPVLKDNVIYERKEPCDPEGYANAKTDIERKRAFCNCVIVRDNIENIPPSFCFCGTGEYKQLWEGILGKQIKIEISKAVTKGDDYCEFAIHI